MESDQRVRCIIIDDERDACDRLENLLKKIPAVEVLSKETKAGNGVDLILDENPDIVFIDVEMPGMSGFDVIKEIKKTGNSPTFIFVTAYDQYAIKAIRSQAFDFLLKPVDIDDLKEAVDRFRKTKEEKQKKLLPEKLKKKYSLSDREIEIIELLLEGKSSQQIADKLYISKHTVDTHRRNIIEKTGVKNSGVLINLVMNPN